MCLLKLELKFEDYSWNVRGKKNSEWESKEQGVIRRV